MAPISVTVASAADEPRAISTIVLAFTNDPVLRWVYPDSDQYLTHFPGFAKLFDGGAFEHGTAYYSEGFKGAALWLPPGAQQDEEPLVELLQSSVDERRQEDLFAMLEQMGSYHPEEPLWYLPLIGVDPAEQGKGHGSALLAHVLAVCDRDHSGAYLENSNPGNTPLYERHGFEVIAEIQVGDSPPLLPMMRTAR
jgi:ribosomal protein S18 acetylase RimI-like enzyme